MQQLAPVALQVPSNTCCETWETEATSVGELAVDFCGVSQSEQGPMHFSGFSELLRRGNIGETPALAVPCTGNPAFACGEDSFGVGLPF